MKPCKNWAQSVSTSFIETPNNLRNPIRQVLEVCSLTTFPRNTQRTTPSHRSLKPYSYQIPTSTRFSRTASICNLKNSCNRHRTDSRFLYRLSINLLWMVRRYSQIKQICLILQLQLQLQFSKIQTNRHYSNKLSFSSLINRYSIMMNTWTTITQITWIINFKTSIVLMELLNNSISFALQALTTIPIILSMLIIRATTIFSLKIGGSLSKITTITLTWTITITTMRITMLATMLLSHRVTTIIATTIPTIYSIPIVL